MQYSRVGAPSRALIHIITDRQEREFTIEDLEEWTEYEVRVQALNGIGMGPWSQPVRGRTRESGELWAQLSERLSRGKGFTWASTGQTAQVQSSARFLSKALICQPHIWRETFTQAFLNLDVSIRSAQI